MTPKEALASTMLAPHEDTPEQKRRASEAAEAVIIVLDSVGFVIVPKAPPR